jgi:hypothetical protein
MSTKPLLSFRASPDLVDEIKQAASEDRRSVSQYISHLIQDALAARRGPVADRQRSAAA